ncbi:MAG: pyridoxamine 5'-phosphate oxidase family protein [Prevotellaceae bacterium]|jgi:nitroimidazol reductase NimA-like FMN-containing flavoprotein (pyridoxamine 5'-phosphate oxidase superfamily)|nr:pyridoxamine 5'-phosphate oxidase family protein [Prevotellaceae bacterium]
MRRKDRQVTDIQEIKAIIDKADGCRITFAADKVLYIVALNFGYERNGELPIFYFHCAHEGKKLDLMKRNNLVCLRLDVDHELEYIAEKVYCTMNYGSIIAMGRLELVTDEEERIKGLNLLMQHSDRPYS